MIINKSRNQPSRIKKGDIKRASEFEADSLVTEV